MTEEVKLLSDISRKLDVLLAITRLSAGGEIDRKRSQVAKDRVGQMILKSSRKPIAYTDLVRATIKRTGAGGSTVKRRISELTQAGFILSSRDGKQVYYESAGIV